MGHVHFQVLSLTCGSPSGEALLSVSCSVATSRGTWTGVCPPLLCSGALPVWDPHPLLGLLTLCVRPLDCGWWMGLWLLTVPTLRRSQKRKGRTAATQRRVEGGQGPSQSTPLPASSQPRPPGPGAGATLGFSAVVAELHQCWLEQPVWWASA